MTILSYLVEGGGGLTFDANGYQDTIKFLVPTAELTGSATNRRREAMLKTGIPRYQEPHPTIPFIRAMEISAEPGEAGVYVTVAYKAPEYFEREPNETEKPTIQVGTTVQEGQSSRDKDGNLISVEFTYTPVDDDGNLGEEITETYIPVLAVQVAQTAIVYQRREKFNPLLKSIKYSNKVNSRTIGIFGPRTLYCAGIEGQSNDGGESYSVEYRFQYNPKTWDAEFYYIDQNTGQPHQDVTIVPPNGYGKAEVYEEIDFSALNVI